MTISRSTLCALCFLIFFILIRILNLQFIPDYLNVYKLDQNHIYDIILSCVSSIIGVLLAIYLLAEEIFKSKFGRGSEIINKRDNPILTVLVISIVFIIQVYISLLTSNWLVYSNITILYYNSIAFIAYILTIIQLFYFSFISYADVITKQIDQITIRLIESYLDKKGKSLSSIEKIKNSPIVIILDSLKNCISQGDYKTFELLSKTIGEKLASLIITNGRDEQRNIVLITREINEALFHEVNRSTNTNFYRSLPEFNYSFHSSFIENCFNISELFEFNKEEQRFLGQLLNTNNKDFIISCIETTHSLFFSYLSFNIAHEDDLNKIHLPEEYLPSDFDFNNYKVEDEQTKAYWHWSVVLERYFNIYEAIAENAIETRNQDSLRNILTNIQLICLEFTYYRHIKIGEIQRRIILNQALNFGLHYRSRWLSKYPVNSYKDFIDWPPHRVYLQASIEHFTLLKDIVEINCASLITDYHANVFPEHYYKIIYERELNQILRCLPDVRAASILMYYLKAYQYIIKLPIQNNQQRQTQIGIKNLLSSFMKRLKEKSFVNETLPIVQQIEDMLSHITLEDAAPSGETEDIRFEWS